MNKKEIISILKDHKVELEEKFSIYKVGLFGSYSSGTYTDDSDLDIIYELKKGKRLGLLEIYELEFFFKELFQMEKIDLVNAKYLNPIIESEIKKRVIYV